MRLIDADELKLKKVYCQERHELVIPVAEVDWMPTAYDVDKVVEELEEAKSYSVSPMFNRGIDTAIEIVKRGGVDVPDTNVGERRTE